MRKLGNRQLFHFVSQTIKERESVYRQRYGKILLTFHSSLMDREEWWLLFEKWNMRNQSFWSNEKKTLCTFISHEIHVKKTRKTQIINEIFFLSWFDAVSDDENRKGTRHRVEEENKWKDSSRRILILCSLSYVCVIPLHINCSIISFCLNERAQKKIREAKQSNKREGGKKIPHWLNSSVKKLNWRGKKKASECKQKAIEVSEWESETSCYVCRKQQKHTSSLVRLGEKRENENENAVWMMKVNCRKHKIKLHITCAEQISLTIFLLISKKISTFHIHRHAATIFFTVNKTLTFVICLIFIVCQIETWMKKI